MAPHGVDLVDEDDRRRVFLRRIEQIAHAARTNAHEHLHEVGARNGVERNPCLTGNGLREEGLTRTRGAVEENAFRNFRADGVIALGPHEELLDLIEFLDRFLSTRNIRERHFRHVLVEELRLRLAELHGTPATLGVHHPEPEEAKDHEEREEGEQKLAPPRRCCDLIRVALRRLRVTHSLDDVIAAVGDVRKRYPLPFILKVFRQHEVDALLIAVDDLGLLNGAAFEELKPLLCVDVLETAASKKVQREKNDRESREAPQPQITGGGFLFFCHVRC